MKPRTDNSDRKPKHATNYCVSFIDLLGQRDALMAHRGPVRKFKSSAESEEFLAMIRNTVGATYQLQRDTDKLLRGIAFPNPDSARRTSLPSDERITLDETLRANISIQNWSDGVMAFSNLGDPETKCKMNGVFGLLVQAGLLCFTGLAKGWPVRGAIDIGWGVELREGELCGAAVASAYELESETAQYPRIVVGSAAADFLQTMIQRPERDSFAEGDRQLAKLCWGMLLEDVDGNRVVHYLGEYFRHALTQRVYAELYAKAWTFIQEQYDKHRQLRATKLALRYATLASYFQEFRPGDETQ